MRVGLCLLWLGTALPSGIQARIPTGVDRAPLPERDFDVATALREKGVDVATLLSSSQLGDLTERSDRPACSTTCTLLQMLYGNEQVLQPANSGYNSSATQYWSTIQSDAAPTCIYKPTNAESVSVFVLLARLTSCHFAVRGGGHSAFAGASSITDGVTVSFASMNEVTLSQNGEIASVGPGNTWESIYTALEKHDLSVIGGRNSDVGPGLILGGGISFFSNVYGWACDNVASYEVVLASGSIVIASPTTNTDLYYALRGGGNNFGIVTRFNLATIKLPGGLMWGGTRIYTEDHFPAVNDAFTQLSRVPEEDPKAGQWLTWINVGGTKLAVVELWYGAPQGSTDAPIFANYTAIPSLSDTTHNQTQSNYTRAIAGDDPDGFRHYFYSMTIKDDSVLGSKAKDTFFAETNLSDIRDYRITMTYQSITKLQIEHMSKNGGNALGLSEEDGPLTLIMIDAKWSDAGDDKAVFRAASTTLEKIKALAVSAGLCSDYIYMNYAAQYQDVIASYGSAEKQKLLDIAREYDHSGVFQRLSPGSFKLTHAPVPETDFFNF